MSNIEATEKIKEELKNQNEKIAKLEKQVKYLLKINKEQYDDNETDIADYNGGEFYK